MKYFVTFPNGSEHEVDVTRDGGGRRRVTVGGRSFEADMVLPRGANRRDCINLLWGGDVVDLWMEGRPPDVGVVVGPARFYARVESERMRTLAAALGSKTGGGAGLVTSPMPGRVLRILVAEGQEVSVGTPLVVVEAMKMENELCAAKEGVVKRVHVAVGATVEGGAKLCEIE